MVARVMKCLAASVVAVGVMAMTVALSTSARAMPFAASCPPYGPCEIVTITITPNTVFPGGTITVTLRGTVFNATFTIVFRSDPVTLGTVTTDAAGTGSGVFTVPAGTAPGAHVVTATDIADPSITASAGVTVLAVASPASVAPSGVLPVTGADVAGITAAGAVAIGAGGLLVLTARRRRRKSWSSAQP